MRAGSVSSLMAFIHLRMMAQHVCTWSIAINDGDGDLETAPAAFLKTLMPAKSGAKNPFRVSAVKSPEKDSNATSVQVQPLTQHPTQPPPYFHYPPHAYYPYNG